jgi:hypothetical protein
MNAQEFRYTWNGNEYRVVVAEDVVSLPGHAGAPGWSMGGFGASISEEWLLHEGRLPGRVAERRALAAMVRASLAAFHKVQTEKVLPSELLGPFARCPACATR